jgi:hypothetical protein
VRGRFTFREPSFAPGDSTDARPSAAMRAGPGAPRLQLCRRSSLANGAAGPSRVIRTAQAGGADDLRARQLPLFAGIYP